MLIFVFFMFFLLFGLMGAFCISPLPAVSVKYGEKEHFPKCDCGSKTVKYFIKFMPIWIDFRRKYTK